ncbi:uncharacterized protein [Anas platyrhynchos]|uniref:uncharacterized protein n=1 Tax=Anas platyrhynchos TaxID=8839 RepID=UPI003AF30C0D
MSRSVIIYFFLSYVILCSYVMLCSYVHNRTPCQHRLTDTWAKEQGLERLAHHDRAHFLPSSCQVPSGGISGLQHGKTSLGWEAIGLGNEREGQCSLGRKSLGSKSLGMGSLEWGGYHSLGKEVLGKVLQERGILWDEVSLAEETLRVDGADFVWVAANVPCGEMARMGTAAEAEKLVLGWASLGPGKWWCGSILGMASAAWEGKPAGDGQVLRWAACLAPKPAVLPKMSARGCSAVGTEPPLPAFPKQPPHSPATMAEGFPRRLPRLPQTQNSPFVVPAVPPTVAAWLLPSLPGAMALPLQPPQVPTLPSALPQATVWHMVPGVQGQVQQLPARVQLPPGGHLPAEGRHLQLGQLPAVGQLFHTAPVGAPSVSQPLLMGTLVPQDGAPLCLGPRAVLHGELLHPAGTCLLQAPAYPGPPPLLVPGHPLQGQVLPAPRTLSSSRGQLPEPCLHAVGLSEDQGPPLPGPTPPEPAQAPATASTQTLTPDAATLAEVPEEPLELLELGPDAFAEAFPQLAGDSQQLQHLQDQLPADLDSSGLEELLSCLDAVEPQDAFTAVPSSPVLKRFLSQLPDLCEDIEEPSTHGLAATRALGEVPSSPGLHPDKVQAGRALQPPAAAVPPLSSPLKPAARPQLRRALPKRAPQQEFIPARRRTLPQPPLAPLKRPPNPDCLPARKRPLPLPPQAPVQSPPDPDFLTALRRALPKPRLSPLQSPPDPVCRRPLPKPLPKRPPQQEFVPARKRTLPRPPLAPLKRPQLLPALRRALPSPPRSPLQSPPPAPAPTGTKWGAKRPVPTSTPSTAQSSQHRRLRTDKTPGKEKTLLLLGQAGQGPKTLHQGKTRGHGALAGSSSQAGSGRQQLASDSTRAPSKRARSLGAAGGQGAAVLPLRRALLLPEALPMKLRAHAHAVRPQGRLRPQASGAKMLQCQQPGTKTPSETFQPLGARAKALGPVRQPPCVQPQPTSSGPSSMPTAPPTLPGSSAVPAAPRPPAGHKAQALPAPPGSTAPARKAPLKQAPRVLGLPAAGGQAQRPAQPRGDYMPCVGPWAGSDAAPTPLEEQESSVPITPQQRPERERLKKLAQEERQRAAHHMKIGPVQFFEQRQKDHARAYSYGYP